MSRPANGFDRKRVLVDKHHTLGYRERSYTVERRGVELVPFVWDGESPKTLNKGEFYLSGCEGYERLYQAKHSGVGPYFRFIPAPEITPEEAVSKASENLLQTVKAMSERERLLYLEKHGLL